MMANFKLHYCACLIVVSLALSANCDKQASLNSVQLQNDYYSQIHFMDRKYDEFMSMLPDLKGALAKYLNEFCVEEKPRCGSETS
jgi:hypothetical protein